MSTPESAVNFAWQLLFGRQERLAMRPAVGTEQAKQWIIFAKNQQSSTYDHSQLNTGHSVRNHEVSIIIYRSGIMIGLQYTLPQQEPRASLFAHLFLRADLQCRDH